MGNEWQREQANTLPRTLSPSESLLGTDAIPPCPSRANTSSVYEDCNKIRLWVSGMAETKLIFLRHLPDRSPRLSSNPGCQGPRMEEVTAFLTLGEFAEPYLHEGPYLQLLTGRERLTNSLPVFLSRTLV